MKKILALTLLLFGFSAQADFDSAVEEYANKNYKQAYESFLRMAKLGEKRAQFNLGVMYYAGQHVEKDLTQAYAWAKLATESETLTEHERKNFKLIESAVVDKKKAEEIYQNYKTQYGTLALMDRLYPTLIKPKNGAAFSAEPEKIVNPRYPRKAAMRGVQGWVRMGFDVDMKGTPRNITILESIPQDVFDEVTLDAVVQWKFKVNHNKDGKPLSQRRLRYTFEYKLEGGGPLAIKPSVYKSTLENAEAGNSNSQFLIGFWESKVPNSDNNQNPTKWYFKAATQGHPAAQFELAESLLKGQGCIQDKAKGLEWLTRSAANNYHEALELLAIQAAEKESLDSHTEAVSHFEKAPKLSTYATLVYARLLATSPFEQVRDANKAIELADNIDDEKFMDPISPYEIKGEAYSLLGDKSEAVDMFEEALDEAEDVGADTTSIEKRIAELSD